MSKLKHRKIYEENFGPIPEGYHIHHKDFNHNNNDPSNLEALHPDDHTKKHGFLNNFIMAASKASQRAIGVNKGKEHTQEFKEAKRLQQIKLWKNKDYRENAIRKISESLRGKKKSEIHKINSGLGNKGKKRTEEDKLKQSERMKIKWKNPIYREAMSNAHKKKVS